MSLVSIDPAQQHNILDSTFEHVTCHCQFLCIFSITGRHCLKMTCSSTPSPSPSPVSSSLSRLSRLATMRPRPRPRPHTTRMQRLTMIIIIISISDKCYYLTGLTEARDSLGAATDVASHGTWNMAMLTEAGYT